MTKSKKWFAAAAVIFVILLSYASYDIATKTTFPGSKPQLPNRLKQSLQGSDSIPQDSVEIKRIP